MQPFYFILFMLFYLLLYSIIVLDSAVVTLKLPSGLSKVVIIHIRFCNVSQMVSFCESKQFLTISSYKKYQILKEKVRILDYKTVLIIYLTEYMSS